MINMVELAGTLKEDPELHDLPSRALRAEFTLVLKQVRWDRTAGCDVIDPVFIRVVCWEDVAETAAKLHQGCVVHLRGQLTQQEVEGRDGKKDRKTKVRALVINTVRTPEGSSY